MAASKSFTVLIPDADNPFALSVIRCLGQISCVTIDICANSTVSACCSRYVRNWHLLPDSKDEETWLQRLRYLLQCTHPDIVLPIHVPAIRFLSRQRSRLEDLARIAFVPGADKLDIADHKWRIAQFLAEKEIPSPATCVYRKGEQPAIPFPLLVKPVAGGYGEGIELLSNQCDFAAFDTRATVETTYILQSYLEGYDIDCSVLCSNGKILAYTIQRECIPGYHPFASPSGVDFVHNEEVLAAVTRLMAAPNWSGIAHIDLRYDEREKVFKIIEINPRYWGSLLGSLISGVNFPYLACRAAMGDLFPVPEYLKIRFVAARAAIKSLFSLRNKSFSYSTTSLPYMLADPLPDLRLSFLGCITDGAAIKKLDHRG